MSDYNAADNSAKSYALAIETMREKLESFHRVQIGDCDLFLGDCRELLPLLPKVDAVVDNSNAVVFNGKHEPASRKHSEKPESPSGVGSPSQRYSGELCERQTVANGNGRAIPSNTDSISAGNSTHGHRTEVEGQGWQAERAIQGRNPEHSLSQDDRKEALQQMRGNEPAGDSPQGQYPHEQCAGESGSALLAVPQQPPQTRMVERKKGRAILTDPPYGIGAYKTGTMGGGVLARQSTYAATEWDEAPCSPEIIKMMRDMSDHQIIFGGNYFELPPARCWLVWDKENGDNNFADCELAWTNLDKAVRMIKWRWHGMLRKGNDGERVHPTQKPTGVMKWCIEQLPDTAQTILDPFMGSGTTGVACVKLGRSFIGIEREPKYFEIACKRIQAAYDQPDMFIEAAKPKAEQLDMLGAAE